MTPAAMPSSAAWLLGWRGSLASPPTSAGSVALLCVFLMVCVCVFDGVCVCVFDGVCVCVFDGVCVCCTVFLVMCGSSNSG